MLSARELAQIRSDMELLLPDTCNVLGVTRTSDGAGGWSDAETIVAGGTAVACRMDFSNPGREGVSATAQTSFKSGLLSLAYDYEISTDNRISFGGETYNITGVNDDQSWIGVKQVSVERLP